MLTDEYTPQEQHDGVEVIHWLAEQEWCSGSVGMIGISWVGFNSLQIATLRPEPLKAVITIASTDDRYAEDVHYSGGCVIASEMLPWATQMLANNALPPDPGRPAGVAWPRRSMPTAWRVLDRVDEPHLPRSEAKNTGLSNLPSRAWNENAAWLQVVLTAVDLVCWTKLLCFTGLAEIAAGLHRLRAA